MVNLPQRIRTKKRGFQTTAPRVSRIYWPHGYGHTGELSSETVGSPFVHRGLEVTVDTKHPWPPKRNKLRNMGLLANLSSFDCGGEFFNSKTYYESVGHSNISIEVPENGLAGRRTYTGPWLPVSLWTLTPLVPLPDLQLIQYGTKGIKLGLPTSPEASITQVIGELKDIPKLPILSLYKALKSNGGKAKNLIRNGGSEYLNIEFGWRPLAKDVQDLHEQIGKTSKTIDQFLRDSGKPVRRKRTLLDTATADRQVLGSLNSIGVGPSSVFLQAISRPIRDSLLTQKVWTVAEYMYYVSAGDSYFSVLKRNEQLANRLFGTRFNISTFWELTPWSWALDWVGNIGDVLANLAAFSSDNLVLRYAYVMFEAEELISVKLTARQVLGGNISTTALSRRYCKRRIRATPYGFGFSMANLSAKQLGILAALGASRI